MFGKFSLLIYNKIKSKWRPDSIHGCDFQVWRCSTVTLSISRIKTFAHKIVHICQLFLGPWKFKSLRRKLPGPKSWHSRSIKINAYSISCVHKCRMHIVYFSSEAENFNLFCHKICLVNCLCFPFFDLNNLNCFYSCKEIKLP